jgi:tetratricopeptide (TPR) repeat protein
MNARRALLLAVQACALCCTQAFGQASTESPPVAQPAATDGAAVEPAEPAPASTAAPVETAPQAASEETPGARTARPVVARAKALFAVGAYGAALAEFMRAYQLLEGDPRQPAVLNNIAVCYERMFRYDLALAYYERYLREGAPDASDRAEVEAAMRALRDLLGTLHITGNVRGEVWVDDRKLGELPAELLVPAGSHVIEVRAKAHESERREVRVTARSHATLHFDLTALPAHRGLSPAYFWVGAGLTGAALITGGVLGANALSKDKDGAARVNDGYYDDGRSAKDLALGADVAFGAALLFGATSALLYFMTDWGDPPRENRMQPEPRTLSWTAGAGPRSLSLQMTGSLE